MSAIGRSTLQPFIDSPTLTSGILSHDPCPNLAFGRDNPISGRSALYSLIGLNDRICLVSVACHPVSLCYAFHITSCQHVINTKQVQLRYVAHIPIFLHGTCASSCVLHRRMSLTNVRFVCKCAVCTIASQPHILLQMRSTDFQEAMIPGTVSIFIPGEKNNSN